MDATPETLDAAFWITAASIIGLIMLSAFFRGRKPRSRLRHGASCGPPPTRGPPGQSVRLRSPKTTNG